jgi:hypothetical protein
LPASEFPVLLQDVRKAFGPLQAVGGVSLHLQPGEFVAALATLDPEREMNDTAVAIQTLGVKEDADLKLQKRQRTTADGDNQAGEQGARLARLLPSQWTVYWIGILSAVGVLCVFSYRNELNALWPSVLLSRHDTRADLGGQHTPDLAAMPRREDMLPLHPVIAVADDPPVKIERPRPASPPKASSLNYSFSFEPANEQERIRTAPIVSFYREKLKKCLSVEHSWKEVTVTFLTSYFISGLTEDQKQRAKRCLKNEVPPGKLLPRTTVVRRAIIRE